jgi:hypothetical protein
MAVIVGVAALGMAGVAAVPEEPERPAASASPAPVSTTLPPETTLEPARLVPVRVEVPSIGVSSPLDRLALEPSGVMQTPVSAARAGWFAGGPAPGEPGPAVIAGHVDSRSGPGVFFRLRLLRPGALIVVGMRGAAPMRFRVTAVRSYAKNAFPTGAVYGPTPGPELRLITCGGAFDRRASSYRDNVVAYAVPT